MVARFRRAESVEGYAKDEEAKLPEYGGVKRTFCHGAKSLSFFAISMYGLKSVLFKNRLELSRRKEMP